MVEIEQIETEDELKPGAQAPENGDEESRNEALEASEERILDAEAIERAAASIDRPTARAHLETLAKKLRRDAAALKRVEESRKKLEAAAVTDGDDDGAGGTEPAASAVPAESKPAAPVKPVAPPPIPSTAKFIPIDKFSFDAGGYNSDRVTLYVPLPGVGSIPRSQVTCDFTTGSFDLTVRDLKGKDYRLFKDNLEKDIDVSTSKRIVKADKVIIKLGKCKGEYGSYDHWQGLTAKKAKKKAGKEDPSAGIMNLMKEMYDDGDDNMKKMIGETMLKQRRGELNKDDMGMGGMGDMGMGGMGM